MKLLAPPTALLVAAAWTAACSTTNVPKGTGPDAATINRPADDGCDSPGLRQAIAQQLFEDQDFHLYICAEGACTVQAFLDGLTFRQVVLRDSPRTSGCIVGPLHEAMTRIYGVFVLNEQTPNLALIYMGIDISVDPAFKKPGFKDLVGQERLDPETWVTHRYVWKKRGYALESTTKAVDAP